MLARLFEDRGLTLDHTYQLNVGGNMDFKNMLERERLESKKISKTQAVTSQLEISHMDPDDVHIGPSDHVPWLKDRKWAYIRMEGRNFGDVPLNVELKLEVWDSPNSAGVIIDAVRCAKVALDRGIGGPIIGPSAYFMKSPPIQFHDDVAHDMVEAFADRGEANPVWPSADVLEEALADVETDRRGTNGDPTRRARRRDTGFIRHALHAGLIVRRFAATKLVAIRTNVPAWSGQSQTGILPLRPTSVTNEGAGLAHVARQPTHCAHRRTGFVDACEPVRRYRIVGLRRA